MGRQVILYGGMVPALEQARMDRDQLMLLIDAQHIRRDLQPERLVDQAKRRGILAVLVLDMTVAMQFRLGPGGACRGDGRQRLQEGLFRFIEPLEWPLARATVYPVSRLVPNPGLQLLIGMRQTVEFAQRHEVALDIFDARLYASLQMSSQLQMMQSISKKFFGSSIPSIPSLGASSL